MARTSSRWFVPLGAAALVAGSALAGQVTASADLPPRTPQEVLVLAQEADVAAFSGILESRTELGLPDLAALGVGTSDPGGDGPAPGIDPIALLTGDNTVRVWVAGPELLRAQLLEDVSETNLVRNGDELWLYRSADATAVHVRLPEAPTDTPDPPSTGPVPTPQELADRVLGALEPNSEITAGEPVVVAGRDAYDLRVAPDDARSLVGAVSLAVDAETGAVLRLRVEARGQDDPAAEVAWARWTPESPPADTFDFSPPPGTTVEEADVSADHGGMAGAVPRTGGGPLDQAGPRPQVVGEGWTAVLEVPAEAAAPADEEMLSALLIPVEGGAVLRTSLVSVLRTDDGRWYVGAVTPETLQAVARGR
jgi:outer membrane lipoprotein-sorting protein